MKKTKNSKKTLKAKQENTEPVIEPKAKKHLPAIMLPWLLLVASWAGFAMFYSQNQ
ncbi:DUF2956 family protein [Pseudomonas sp. HK3]